MARKIELELRVRNAMARGLKSAGAALQKFGQSARRIGAFFAKAFIGAGAAVAGFAAKALQAYSVQEAAEVSMAAALRAHGEEIEANMAAIKRMASAIQDETGVADENVVARMARLRMLGVETDKLDAAAKATIALKSANIDEEAAIKAVAMASVGNFAALSRYIPALRTATNEAEKAQAVNDFLAKGYAQQKAALNTVAGQWGALKGRISDVWEEIGAAIAQNGKLTDVLRRAGEAVKEFGSRIKAWVEDGGIERAIETGKLFVQNIKETFLRLASYKIHVQLGLISAAAVAGVAKLIALSKTFKILAIEINRATLAKAKNAIAAAINAVQLKALGGAASTAAVKVAALKAGMVALKGVSVAAAAVGLFEIARAALQARDAARELNREINETRGQRKSSIEQFGAPPEILKRIREAQDANDESTLSYLEKRFPKAVALARERVKAEEQAADAIQESVDGMEQLNIAQQAGTDQQKALAEKEEKDAEARMELDERIAKSREDLAALDDRLAQEQKDKERDLRDAVRDAAEERKRAAEQAIDDLKKQIELKEELARKTIDEFLAEKRAAEERAKAAKKDARRADELEYREGQRGRMLSKKDREWLKAYRAIQAARQEAEGKGELGRKLAEEEGKRETAEGVSAFADAREKEIAAAEKAQELAGLRNEREQARLALRAQETAKALARREAEGADIDFLARTVRDEADAALRARGKLPWDDPTKALAGPLDDAGEALDKLADKTPGDPTKALAGPLNSVGTGLDGVGEALRGSMSGAQQALDVQVANGLTMGRMLSELVDIKTKLERNLQAAGG